MLEGVNCEGETCGAFFTLGSFLGFVVFSLGTLGVLVRGFLGSFGTFAFGGLPRFGLGGAGESPDGDGDGVSLVAEASFGVSGAEEVVEADISNSFFFWE